MSKRDRELIWPFQNLEDILCSWAAKIIRELQRYLCALFARAEEDEGTTAFGDHRPNNGRTSATLGARRNELTRCAMSSTVTLRTAAAELVAAATATSFSLFNAAVASFSTNTRGRRTSVRVIATRARCPRRVLVLVLPQRFRPRLVDPVSCHGCCCARRFLDLAHGCGLRHRIEDVGRNCPVEECWILWHSSNIRAQPRNV
jgi:hypothetical protein